MATQPVLLHFQGAERAHHMSARKTTGMRTLGVETREVLGIRHPMGVVTEALVQSCHQIEVGVLELKIRLTDGTFIGVYDQVSGTERDEIPIVQSRTHDLFRRESGMGSLIVLQSRPAIESLLLPLEMLFVGGKETNIEDPARQNALAPPLWLRPSVHQHPLLRRRLHPGATDTTRNAAGNNHSGLRIRGGASTTALDAVTNAAKSFGVRLGEVAHAFAYCN